MTANGEMAGDAIVPEIASELGEAADVELEDDRESDDHGIVAPDHGEDLVEVDLEIHDLYEMAAAPERGSEITQAQILLLLETDEHDSVRGRVAARQRHLVLICVVAGRRHGGSPPGSLRSQPRWSSVVCGVPGTPARRQRSCYLRDLPCAISLSTAAIFA